MNRKKFWLVLVFVLTAVWALSLGHAQAQTTEKISGTGNISVSGVMRTEEPLDPECVFRVTRIGEVTYTGVIQTLAKGHAEDIVLSNRCVDPPEGPARRVHTLDEVMIAGRTGGIVIEEKGEFAGDVASPEGTHTLGHLEIRGISGDLKGVRGHGISVGGGRLTKSFQTYWIEIRFDAED